MVGLVGEVDLHVKLLVSRDAVEVSKSIESISIFVVTTIEKRSPNIAGRWRLTGWVQPYNSHTSQPPDPEVVIGVRRVFGRNVSLSRTLGTEWGVH